MVAVLVVLVTVGLAHARETSLEVPPGWIEDTQAGAAMREKLRDAEGTRATNARAWKPTEGVGGIQLVEVVVGIGRTPAHDMIAKLEDIARSRLPAGWQAVSTTRHDEPQRVTIDQAFETANARMRMRRLYVADGEGSLHGVVVSCVEATASTACAPVFATIQLNISDVVDLVDTRLRTAGW